MEFKDRVSAHPNRYLMTDESGATSHVLLERADEPTTVGTPLTAETFNGAFGEINKKVGEIDKKVTECAPKGDAIIRKDTDKDRNLNTQSYTANLDAKIFVVKVGITGDVDAACMVCIDFWQIPKSNDIYNALKILLPIEITVAGTTEQAILYAYRTDKGVPIFHTEGQVYIKGVSSYM